MIRRWAFRIVWALSLVLCFSTLALWAWSSPRGRMERFYSVDRTRLRCIDLYVVIVDGVLAVTRDTLIVQQNADLDDWLDGVRHDIVLENQVSTRDGGGMSNSWEAQFGFGGFDYSSASITPVAGPGFGYMNGTPGFGWSIPVHFKPVGRTTVLAIPIWALALAFAMLPMISLIRIVSRKRRRAKPNHCRSCGYNLTGNMSGVCPECGQKTGELVRT
jgi:hypothetical protein